MKKNVRNSTNFKHFTGQVSFPAVYSSLEFYGKHYVQFDDEFKWPTGFFERCSYTEGASCVRIQTVFAQKS